MKKWFSHIILLLVGAILTVSCNDDPLGKQGIYDGKVGLKLALSLPGGVGTRAGGTGAGTGSEPGTDYENLIERTDIRLLVFQEGTFQEEVTGLRVFGSGVSYYLEGVTSREYEGGIETVVLANLNNRGVNPDVASFAGKTTKEVYKLLEYTYGETAWTVDDEHHIPMWGSTKLNIVKGQQNSGYVDMYRAIAKVGLTVGGGAGLDNFTLKSIRIYFAESTGYCAPMPENLPVNGEAITTPSIPEGSKQIGVSAPLAYEVAEGEYRYEDKIYIPEANNKAPGDGKKRACIVVGGYYGGEGLVDEGEESFYRIDLKDDLESGGNDDDLRDYDVLRNHLYRIDIRSAGSPGTSTPEDALENVVVGLDVSIEEWDLEPMRSIPDQYTLTTSTSIVSFSNLEYEGDMTVTTDYGMETDSEINGKWTIEDAGGKWFTAVQDADNKTIHITAKQNYGVGREGIFYVQSGNLRKQITVRQDQPATANCYVVGDGTHDLIVIIKGNGNKGLKAGEMQLDETAALQPVKIKIIWETNAGLVTLNDAPSNNMLDDGTVTNYNTATGIINYTVNTEGATIGGIRGGNALIGAFDKKGVVVWSWHIWAYQDASDGPQDQEWTLNGYSVMDRNLGALSNSPGVASLGLLYQWGRKDPFIGAAYTNDTYGGEGRLSTQNYYNYQWAVTQKRANTTVAYTIKQPTTLTYDGLSSSSYIGDEKSYLWGTNGGLSNTKDLGSKTIYDPCPEGYRVPPVDAFVFKNAKGKTSEDNNWNDNLLYLPHKASKQTSNAGISSGKYYSGGYVWNAEYYGFYLNYKELEEPGLASGYKTDDRTHYDIADHTNLAWLPIGGAYDPHVNSAGLSFKNIKITQGSSLSVNSFLWTNSSVESQDDEIRPAAMFLHGTETGGGGNGRHIHALKGTSASDNIIAQPQQAGAVRCVRDRKKDFHESNKVPGSAKLGKSKGSSTDITIISVNEEWRIVDGGAPWLQVSPERGTFDKGEGQQITFTALQANDTGLERSATVLIQINGEAGPRAIKVTQRRNWR